MQNLLKILWFYLFMMGSLVAFPLSKSLGEQIFQYTDENGVIHFTNVPTDSRFKPQPLPNIPNFPPQQYGYFDFQNTIHLVSRKEGIDPLLIRAVIKAESNFDPFAISKKGARGLMQLMPPTASSLSVQNPFDPTENISGGVRYLKYLINQFNRDIILALAAYNAGETTVKKYKAIPPYKETRIYVTKVLRLYKRYIQEERQKTTTQTLTPRGEFLWTHQSRAYEDMRDSTVQFD